jgi:hypothetical protein
LTAEEKYVPGAYLVVFLAVLTYVLIIALKITPLEQRPDELEANRLCHFFAAREHAGDTRGRCCPPAAGRMSPGASRPTAQEALLELDEANTSGDRGLGGISPSFCSATA